MRCTDHSVCAFTVSPYVAQLGGSKEPTRVSFKIVEPAIPLPCDPHPWNFAYISVFDHSYYAITDANGGFILKNVPDEKNATKHLSETVALGSKHFPHDPQTEAAVFRKLEQRESWSFGFRSPLGGGLKLPCQG